MPKGYPKKNELLRHDAKSVKLPRAVPAKGELPATNPMSYESFMELYDEVKQRGKQKSPICISAKDPMLATQCLWLYAQGMSKNKIEKQTGVSRITVSNLIFDHSKSVEEQRKRFAPICMMAANEFTELLLKKAAQLEDDPDQLAAISPDKLAVTVGIMTDQHAKLTGNNTITIEHKKGPSIDDAAKELEAVRKRLAERAKNAVIDAEVVTDTTR